MTGYSRVTPLAAITVRAVRAMSMAVRALAIFPTLTCTGVSVPAALSWPRCRARSCAWYSDTAIHASLDWVSWNPPIGLPNCVRVVAYDTADSRQARAAPVTPQTMPNRASVRHDNGPRSPVTPGSTADDGSRTESRTSSEVMDARSDIFLWMSRAENPRVLRGTRNPRMPSSVEAHTTAMSAMEPLVIHIFVPLSTQSEPSRTAWVRIEAGSDPWSGSVSPKQPIASPAAIRGSHSSFCSSLPYFQIGNMASDPVGDGAGARASVSRQVHAEQAELAQLGQHRPGQHARLEPVGDLRQDMVG